MYTNTLKNSIPDFIADTLTVLYMIPEIEWVDKPHATKWSKKEVLGHLIDSAQNNIRRLIVTQYQPNDKIIYEQNKWVEVNQYQTMSTRDIIDLWRLLNLQYHHIAQQIPVNTLDLTCDTGKGEISLHTLSFLIEDYWGHQQHHLRQIIG